MARITVEDCEKIVPNRFDLVVLAVQRARQIINGDPITLENSDEKKPVIALREIAARTVSVDALKESSIKSFRTFAPEEDEEEDVECLIEEDTYNPYAEIQVASIESSPAVDDDEKSEEQEDSREA